MSDIALFLGDCLQHMKEMESGSVDLIVSDPPYEIEDMSKYFLLMLSALSPNGSIYIFGNKNIVAEHWFKQLKIENKEIITWYYKNSPKPKGRWRMSQQSIIYGYRKDSCFFEDSVRVKYSESAKKLNGRTRPSSGRLKELKPYKTDVGALPRDVIEHPALTGHLSRERLGHPDQKPIGLIKKIVSASSKENDVVFDPFMGSGTTGAACVQLKRNFIGCELKPEYFSLSSKRILETQPVEVQ